MNDYSNAVKDYLVQFSVTSKAKKIFEKSIGQNLGEKVDKNDGYFAKEDIAEGEIIATLYGDVFLNEEINTAEHNANPEYLSFLFQVQKSGKEPAQRIMVLKYSQFGCIRRSCFPNAVIKQCILGRKRMHLYLVANQHIEKGREITILMNITRLNQKCILHIYPQLCPYAEILNAEEAKLYSKTPQEAISDENGFLSASDNLLNDFQIKADSIENECEEEEGTSPITDNESENGDGGGWKTKTKIERDTDNTPCSSSGERFQISNGIYNEEGFAEEHTQEINEHASN